MKKYGMCRAHLNLGNLTPGETADLWLDINVPKKSGSENKGRDRKRDKVLGFFMGAKGNQEKDVENCQVHIQVSTYYNYYYYNHHYYNKSYYYDYCNKYRFYLFFNDYSSYNHY